MQQFILKNCRTYIKSLHVSAHNKSSGQTNTEYVKEGNIKTKKASLSYIGILYINTTRFLEKVVYYSTFPINCIIDEN